MGQKLIQIVTNSSLPKNLAGLFSPKIFLALALLTVFVALSTTNSPAFILGIALIRPVVMMICWGAKEFFIGMIMALNSVGWLFFIKIPTNFAPYEKRRKSYGAQPEPQDIPLTVGWISGMALVGLLLFMWLCSLGIIPSP